MKLLKNVVLSLVFVIFSIKMIGCAAYSNITYRQNVASKNLNDSQTGDTIDLNSGYYERRDSQHAMNFNRLASAPIICSTVIDEAGNSIHLYQGFIINYKSFSIDVTIEDDAGVEIGGGIIMGVADKERELRNEKYKARKRVITVEEERIDSVIVCDTNINKEGKIVEFNKRKEARVTIIKKTVRDQSWRTMVTNIPFVIDTLYIPFGTNYRVIASKGEVTKVSLLNVKRGIRNILGNKGHWHVKFD